jgi:hypothetical protein
MRAGRKVTCLLSGILLALPLVSARASDPPAAVPPAAPSAVPRHHTKKHKPLPPLVLPPLAGGPLRQVPMDQIPSTPPVVTYENGLLSVSADNATLGEILRNIRELTGASIDLPPGGGNERVVTKLGPGAPRDVLAGLLDGVPFNYVILGSAANPAVIANVILTPKPSNGGQPETQTVAYQPPQSEVPPVRMPQAFRGAMLQQNVRPGEQAGAAAEDSDDSDNTDDKDDDSDQAQPAQGMGQPDPNTNNQDQATDGSQPNAGPKTPEQLLEMIRRGQPPAPPAANPQQPPQN